MRLLVAAVLSIGTGFLQSVLGDGYVISPAPRRVPSDVIDEIKVYLPETTLKRLSLSQLRLLGEAQSSDARHRRPHLGTLPCAGLPADATNVHHVTAGDGMVIRWATVRRAVAQCTMTLMCHDDNKEGLITERAILWRGRCGHKRGEMSEKVRIPPDMDTTQFGQCWIQWRMETVNEEVFVQCIDIMVGHGTTTGSTGLPSRTSTTTSSCSTSSTSTTSGTRCSTSSSTTCSSTTSSSTTRSSDTCAHSSTTRSSTTREIPTSIETTTVTLTTLTETSTTEPVYTSTVSVTETEVTTPTPSTTEIYTTFEETTTVTRFTTEEPYTTTTEFTIDQTETTVIFETPTPTSHPNTCSVITIQPSCTCPEPSTVYVTVTLISPVTIVPTATLPTSINSISMNGGTTKVDLTHPTHTD